MVVTWSSDFVPYLSLSTVSIQVKLPHTLRCSSSILVSMVTMEYCLRVCSQMAMSGSVCTTSVRRYTATVSGWRSKCKVQS